MHFDIFVEDISGRKALEILIPKLIGSQNSYKITSYKGIGRIPRSMKAPKDASKRILSDNLPKLLRGHGKKYAKYKNYQAVVFVVCDLDDKCQKALREELLAILDNCNPQPETRFCFAIEEGEAWLLGDLTAVKAAYPRAKDNVLSSYINDSICGTWEKLADAVYPGGAKDLKAKGWKAVGQEKSKWAEAIPPYMEIDKNLSPSFQYFTRKIKELAGR